LQEYVNIEEDEDFSQWDSPPALAILQRDIEHVDPTKVKLVSTSKQPHMIVITFSYLKYFLSYAVLFASDGGGPL